MPIFEYECAKCKRTFEVVASATSSTRITCPRCSSRRVTKLMSGFAVGKGKARASGGSAQAKSSGACGSCSSKSCSTCR